MKSSKREVVQSQVRSLRSLPPTYAPSLVFSHGKKYRDQSFYTFCDGCSHIRSVAEMRRMYCVTSNHGWLVLLNYFSTECYLFNPITLTKIHLPPLIYKSYDLGVLTSYPDDPDCVLMLFSWKKKSCVFCRIGDSSWIVQVSGSKKKNQMLLQPYTSVVTCKGRVYLFVHGGMAIIDVHGTSVSIQPHELEPVKHSLPDVFFYMRFFVESCGEIFGVDTIHLGHSYQIVQRLDVFKLDFLTMTWVKVQNLGDRIFLLGKSSTSLSSTALGVKGNCIYFCASDNIGFYRFDMDDAEEEEEEEKVRWRFLPNTSLEEFISY